MPAHLRTHKPHKLLDRAREMLKVESDRQLAKLLGTDAPVICRVRHGKRPCPDRLILAIHKATEIPVKEIEAMLGVM